MPTIFNDEFNGLITQLASDNKKLNEAIKLAHEKSDKLLDSMDSFDFDKIVLDILATSIYLDSIVLSLGMTLRQKAKMYKDLGIKKEDGVEVQ